MNNETLGRIGAARSNIAEAIRLLDAAITAEWEHMEDTDVDTEELIDKVESVRDALAKQETLLFQVHIEAQAKDIGRSIPNAMRMLEES